MILYVYFHNYYLTFYIVKNIMRCQLHIFILKAEDNTRNSINYCTSIRQEKDTVCAEKYYMKIIMYMIFYFICTNFWKYFVYCGFNTVVY